MHSELTLEVEQVRSKIKKQLREIYRKLSNGKSEVKMASEYFVGNAYMTHFHEHGLLRRTAKEMTDNYTWDELDTESLLWALKMLETRQVAA